MGQLPNPRRNLTSSTVAPHSFVSLSEKPRASKSCCCIEFPESQVLHQWEMAFKVAAGDRCPVEQRVNPTRRQIHRRAHSYLTPSHSALPVSSPHIAGLLRLPNTPRPKDLTQLSGQPIQRKVSETGPQGGRPDAVSPQILDGRWHERIGIGRAGKWKCSPSTPEPINGQVLYNNLDSTAC